MKRPDRTRGGSAGQQRRGPKHKHPSGLPMRQARPRQIAARVETLTFRQLAALRKLLDKDNGALITRGIELLVLHDLSPPQRRLFKMLMAASA